MAFPKVEDRTIYHSRDSPSCDATGSHHVFVLPLDRKLHENIVISPAQEILFKSEADEEGNVRQQGANTAIRHSPHGGSARSLLLHSLG